jgi:hypothetical protein
MGDSNGEWVSRFQEKLGAEIASARRDLGLSAVKVSTSVAAMGVSIHRVALGRIESGKQSPTATELVALGIVLSADCRSWIATASIGVPETVGRAATLRRVIEQLDEVAATLEEKADEATVVLGQLEALPESDESRKARDYAAGLAGGATAAFVEIKKERARFQALLDSAPDA